jgi:hypothetical protein
MKLIPRAWFSSRNTRQGCVILPSPVAAHWSGSPIHLSDTPQAGLPFRSPDPCALHACLKPVQAPLREGTGTLQALVPLLHIVITDPSQRCACWSRASFLSAVVVSYNSSTALPLAFCVLFSLRRLAASGALELYSFACYRPQIRQAHCTSTSLDV